MVFSQAVLGVSLHFVKITLLFPNLQGETGSHRTASSGNAVGSSRSPSRRPAGRPATHNSSNANILKRRDPKQREFTRYFKEIVPARIRQFESDVPSHAVASNRRSAKEKLRPEGSAQDVVSALD